MFFILSNRHISHLAKCAKLLTIKGNAMLFSESMVLCLEGLSFFFFLQTCQEVSMQQITRVLTPIDFSENATTVLKAAAYVAGAFKAELHLVFVVQNFEDYSGFFVPPVNLPNLEEELFASAEQQMEAFVKENTEACTAAGVTNLSSKVLAGDVGEEVLRYADQKKVQLIVMGTHGYKGLERIMFGSVADKVVKTANCPVMTINPYREGAKD